MENFKDFTLKDFERLPLEEKLEFFFHLSISPLMMLVLLAMKKGSEYTGVADIKKELIRYFEELNIPREEALIYLGYMRLDDIWKRIKYDKKLKYVLLNTGDSYILTDFGEKLKQFIKYLIKTYVTYKIQQKSLHGVHWYVHNIFAKSDEKLFNNKYLLDQLERIRNRKIVEYVINPIINLTSDVYSIKNYQAELDASDIREFLSLFNKNITTFEEAKNKILEVLPCESNGNGMTLAELREELRIGYHDLMRYLSYLKKIGMVRRVNEDGSTIDLIDEFYKIC